MPSGDVSFYAQNRAHQKWLMDNKHLWSKQFHPDLEATPSTYSVMVQGVPKTFDVTSKTLLARLASESNFKASEVARLRWMGSNSALEKKKKQVPLSSLSSTRILPSGLKGRVYSINMNSTGPRDSKLALSNAINACTWVTIESGVETPRNARSAEVNMLLMNAPMNPSTFNLAYCEQRDLRLRSRAYLTFNTLDSISSAPTKRVG